MYKKTILLPIYNGMRSRNFFRNDLYPELVKDEDLQLVILVPPYKMDLYNREFSKPNVVFQSWDAIPENYFSRLVKGMAFSLLDTVSIKTLQYVAYLKTGNKISYLAKRLFTNVLGNRRWAIRLMRFLDGRVAVDNRVVAFIDQYKPDLVIAPDIMFGPDVAVLRAAKRKDIPTLGMVRSWDNLTSRGIIRSLPDKLIVHASFMKKEAVKYSGMKPENVLVLGIPHFDLYFQQHQVSRDEFYKSLNIPTDRRLVLCAPFFDTYSHQSGLNIVNGLVGAIKSGKLPADIHLIVRYRPESMSDDDSQAEKDLEATGYATVTKPYAHSFSVIADGRPEFEYSQADLDLFYNSLYFSDVTINTISTLTVDAIALDKPVINVRYDGDPNCPPANQIKNYSQFEHYQDIEDAGGVRLAYSMDELIKHLRDYLADPGLDASGRRKVRSDQIEFMDGLSGKRYADFIKDFVYKPKLID
ncbi:MAG: CDP-glycerol glycerophosphotransferase family protein [bacterium]|nr:CDP-glycerol glycerophosphotransferase family protein [bacterium]